MLFYNFWLFTNKSKVGKYNLTVFTAHGFITPDPIITYATGLGLVCMFNMLQFDSALLPQRK